MKKNGFAKNDEEDVGLNFLIDVGKINFFLIYVDATGASLGAFELPLSSPYHSSYIYIN